MVVKRRNIATNSKGRAEWKGVQWRQQETRGGATKTTGGAARTTGGATDDRGCNQNDRGCNQNDGGATDDSGQEVQPMWVLERTCRRQPIEQRVSRPKGS